MRFNNLFPLYIHNRFYVLMQVFCSSWGDLEDFGHRNVQFNVYTYFLPSFWIPNRSRPGVIFTSVIVLRHQYLSQTNWHHNGALWRTAGPICSRWKTTTHLLFCPHPPSFLLSPRVTSPRRMSPSLVCRLPNVESLHTRSQRLFS